MPINSYFIFKNDVFSKISKMSKMEKSIIIFTIKKAFSGTKTVFVSWKWPNTPVYSWTCQKVKKKNSKLQFLPKKNPDQSDEKLNFSKNAYTKKITKLAKSWKNEEIFFVKNR